MLSEQQLEYFKNSLSDALQDLIESMGATSENFSSNEKNKMGGDIIDQASHLCQQEFLIDLSYAEQTKLAQIQKALEKIRNKTFGSCENCNTNIDENRLKAIPYSSLCVQCKTAELRPHTPTRTMNPLQPKTMGLDNTE